MKTQTIRLFDVFLVGPLMVWGGRKAAMRGDVALGTALALLGAATVVYNGRNYLQKLSDG